MPKRGIGKYITFAAVLGAVVAGISYFTRYKSFHKELEEDFHDFEDEFDGGFKESVKEPEESELKRNYVSIHRDSEAADLSVTDTKDAITEEEPAAAENAAETKEDFQESSPSGDSAAVVIEDEEMYD